MRDANRDRENLYDVVVVGSGFGAAPPALRLAEAGYRVLVLEKGPDIVPERDFRQTQSPAYFRRYLRTLSGKGLNLTFAEGLGGGSGFYEMVSLRAPSIVFDQRGEGGRPLWPDGVGRAALDPHYDTAERMLRVEQIAAEDVPKTGQVFALLMKRLGYSCDRARYAARGCVGSGYCVSGCVFGAKQSLHLNYLPAAVAAGAEIRTDTNVADIAPTGSDDARSDGRALASYPPRWEIRCRSRARGEERLRARLLVVAAGTVGSAALLLRSKKRMPRLSRHVGRNVAFNGSVKAVGLLPREYPDGDLYVGRSHPGMVSYEFLESHGIVVSAVKPLPLQIVAGARLVPSGGKLEEDYWGAEHVALMRTLRRRGLILYATGLTPPAGRIRLRSDGTPSVSAALDAGWRRYHHEVHALLESILARAGCAPVPVAYLDPSGTPYEELHFFTTHQVGSCRMAESVRHGVVNASGEVFGYPGLYVSDASSLPSSLAVNSSLTVLANAERIAAGILARHGRAPMPQTAQVTAAPHSEGGQP
ncbi:MAG TPA: GMC family oxidoreductase [Acidobacteriota bacterium]|nr:GMC family oxidoreductase [Acidobacteriota bacterium]